MAGLLLAPQVGFKMAAVNDSKTKEQLVGSQPCEDNFLAKEWIL